MKNCFLLIAIASFLLGCSGNKKENTLQDEEGTPVINLSSDNVSKVALLPLSEAAAKVEIVSLEVTDESLIGEITKMKVTDSDIWVKHYKDNHVLRFSRSGKFLNKVGKVGQGPEEYIRMADFFVDENTKEVYIQTTIVGVKVYDYEGNYKRTAAKTSPDDVFMTMYFQFALYDNKFFTEHKVTAIVGASGSGKTTLVKLMLGFYSPNKGAVKVGDASLENINPHLWRAKTGAVMQDGFIFSETIAQNIAVGEEQIDVERLRHAVAVANIRDFIDSLPLGYNTKIGMEGNGISQGQKQRLLIARAVYKNPEFLFFDEATNALDANNEKEIMEHLHEFYKGKTVVVVAHRLSTVKDADKIVVLDRGCIAEEGTHRELTERKGMYYRLVKNQLELGS